MALSNLTTTWEVRTGGNDANGAGYDSSVSGGTDYSQQDSPQVTFDGSTITATTSGTSAVITITGYTVSNNDKGNIVKVSGGTNFTTGYYCVTAVNTGSNTWTLDRNVSSGAGSAMTGRMGGAALTINQITNTAAVARNFVYVKAGSGYTITATITIPNSMPLRIIGYTTTRGDGGTVTVTCNTNSVSMVTIGITSAQSAYRWENFTFQHTATTRGIGFTQNGAFADFGQLQLINCTIDGCTEGIGSGLNDWTEVILYNCVIKNCSTAGIQTSVKQTVCIDCFFKGNADGVHLNNNRTDSYSTIFFLRCIFASNTGNGFKSTSQPSFANYFFESCVFYNNTTDGIWIDVSGVTIMARVRNSIFMSNGGYGINIVQTNSYEQTAAIGEGNAFYNNTSGQVQRFPNDGAVTLSGDPFVAASSDNFAIDNTANEGALLRAKALPTAKRGGGTQYLDVGAMQHQEAAAGGLVVRPDFQGGF